jgi:hypothetical protein
MPAKSKIDQAGALPIKSAVYGVHLSTVWRALRDGRLEYAVVGRRKLILPPVIQRENATRRTSKDRP